MMRSVVTGLLVCALLLASLGSARAEDDVSTAHQALLEQYAGKLDELAAWCRQQQLHAAVEELQAWLPPRSPDQLTLFVLPSSITQPPPSDAAGDAWRQRWQQLRDEQADALFALARQAAEHQQPSLALRLVTEAVRENPRHEAGRKVLGYTKVGENWVTPFEAKQLEDGKVWHDQFGWLAAAHVERYEQGERYYLGRWLSADEERRVRSDLSRGWRIESDNFLVATNHSLEEGLRLSRQLENLSAIWQQVFPSYWLDAGQLQRQFAGQPSRATRRRHDVTYFRTRDEYENQLRRVQAQIDNSLGLYLAPQHRAYFFAGEQQDAGTLYHEATHQLFQETRRAPALVGGRSNYWITEGVACYMESLADHGGYFTLGGANAGRVPAARHRLQVDKFYVPLAELVSLGKFDLQRDARLPRIYSQSAGLVDFLMHAHAGRYRQPLVDYLVAVYTGKADAATLAELTGEDYATLDAEYQQYMSDSAPPHAAATGKPTATAGP